MGENLAVSSALFALTKNMERPQKFGLVVAYNVQWHHTAFA